MLATPGPQPHTFPVNPVLSTPPHPPSSFPSLSALSGLLHVATRSLLWEHKQTFQLSGGNYPHHLLLNGFILCCLPTIRV